MSLPIHECFHSWQGEGCHMGRSAYFVRLYGCPLHCPWCDSAGTWHAGYKPEKLLRATEAEIAKEVPPTADFVVVTGGEPCVHDLRLLTATLHEKGHRVHLETSGAYPISGTFDWITVSPKDKWSPDHPCREDCVGAANEFKLIIEAPGDMAYWANVLTRNSYHGQPIWLHPEWSKRNDWSLLNAMTEYVKGAGEPFRVGWQLHKLYRADTLDRGSRAPVPLGGNPLLGY